MLNLTEAQRFWILSIEDREMSDLFNKIRQECLQQINSTSVNLERGAEVQHQVAALFRIEKSFISFRQQFAKDEENNQEK